VSPLSHSQVRERKRKQQAAAVVTSSPFKQSLLEKRSSTTAKRKKGNDPSNDKKNKKQKKQTCRMDKPRGRKPKGIALQDRKTCMKDKEPRRRKLNTTLPNNKTKNSSEDAKCLICNECFSDSLPGERWVQCQKCMGWCHVECAINGKTKTFVCDFCH